MLFLCPGLPNLTDNLLPPAPPSYTLVWTKCLLKHKAQIFRCASISWFQAVSGSVIYRFQLAHLRVFQIIVFRVRLSCPWRKTDQKFRDQIKFLKLYSILCYNCWVLQTAHLCYWQPTWPSHPVFLSGCFIVVFSKMKSVSSSKKQNCSHILFCWFVPLFHTLNSMCQFHRHFLIRLSWSMAC